MGYGKSALLNACRHCLASLFTDRALSYRVDEGFDHFKVALSIGVQQMVRSDLGAAGVMFTLDTETGFTNVVLINSAYGLGESVVKGRVDPDEFLVFKPTLRQGFRAILKRTVGSKQEKLVYATRGGHPTRILPVPPKERGRLGLNDDEVLTLARLGCLIEDYYSMRAERPMPMDIEWAKDGRTRELFILQVRPEIVHAPALKATLEVYRVQRPGTRLLTGKSIGEKIGVGPVRVVKDLPALQTFRPGEVLVADMTDPDWESTMKMAAIITNRGGRTCHAVIVSRELGVPCVVGTTHGTAVLRDGQVVTVSCAEGEEGVVYEGAVPYTHEELNVERLPWPRTKVMVNVGNPAQAFALSFLPNDGVGLAREEFVISSAIQAHPMALIRFDSLPAGPIEEQIAQSTYRYPHKPDYFVDRLAEGVGRLAAAFYAKDVIVRLSDFKTNEYAGLMGGEEFEPKEENPMLGFRGASRYCDERDREEFL